MIPGMLDWVRAVLDVDHGGPNSVHWMSTLDEFRTPLDPYRNVGSCLICCVLDRIKVVFKFLFPGSDWGSLGFLP